MSSVGLFGKGIASSTGCELKCDWCKKIHNKGFDVDRDGIEGDSVSYDCFGELTIAECCYDKVESAVLAHMHNILTWQDKRLKYQAKILNHEQEALNSALKTIEMRHDLDELVSKLEKCNDCRAPATKYLVFRDGDSILYCDRHADGKGAADLNVGPIIRKILARNATTHI